ncbi:MAG: hypothetical protein ACE5G2_07175 [Candidatus Krumholzibacteriia bacterium]
MLIRRWPRLLLLCGLLGMLIAGSAVSRTTAVMTGVDLGSAEAAVAHGVWIDELSAECIQALALAAVACSQEWIRSAILCELANVAVLAFCP